MSAILETLPARVFEPRSIAELAEMMRETRPLRIAVAPIGSGTQLDLGNPPTRYDAAVRLGALQRIIEYAPEDQIVVVEAGITLGTLQTRLAEHGQRLAIDPPDGAGMSIGGILATNAYGPCASRYGTIKDLVVGVTVVRADGAIARAGGKVVKNVAGFDLSKLMAGSLGTLAIVASIALRVHPLPEMRRSITLRLPVGDVWPFALALRDAQLEPSGFTAGVDGNHAVVTVSFEGFDAGVEVQVAACLGHARSFKATLMDEPEAFPWKAWPIALRVTYPPTTFADIVRLVAAPAVRAQAWPLAGTLIANADELDEFALADMRASFESLGGSLVVHRMPGAWRGRVDAWGTPPPAIALMRSLKQRFDPDARLNPGRFVGGI